MNPHYLNSSFWDRAATQRRICKSRLLGVTPRDPMGSWCFAWTAIFWMAVPASSASGELTPLQVSIIHRKSGHSDVSFGVTLVSTLPLFNQLKVSPISVLMGQHHP